MRQYITLCLSSILFSSILYAQDVEEPTQIESQTIEVPKEQKVEPTPPSINALIEQVKIAKVEDRRVLMNQLKVQLREMNKENRSKAMMELKQSFSKNSPNKGDDQAKQHEHKNLHEQQGKHQPKFRRLRNGSGRGNGNGQGHGHK